MAGGGVKRRRSRRRGECAVAGAAGPPEVPPRDQNINMRLRGGRTALYGWPVAKGSALAESLRQAVEHVI